MYKGKSPRLSPLWLSASSSACHGLLIITVITPLQAQRDKNARELTGNAAITDMQMRQRDVCCARCAKYTKGSGTDAKAENDVCVMMLPLVVVGWRKAVCQSVREATTASGVDNAASDWQTPLNGIIFTLRERLITMQKQLEGTQKYINEQCR